MRAFQYCGSILGVSASLVLMPLEASAVTIRFDYRFDEGQISQHPDRKKTLELAAAIWGQLFPIASSASGTKLQFRHPQTGAMLMVPMPKHDGDLLVFIFPRPDGKASAGAISGATDGYGDGKRAFTKEVGPRGKPVRNLYQRANGIPYQPWVGVFYINFAGSRPWFYAQSPDRVDDIPSATHWDFLSTALHELGHILGFSAEGSPFGFTDLVVKNAFTGARAVSLDRRPIPIDLDKNGKIEGHIGDYNSATWNGRLNSGPAQSRAIPDGRSTAPGSRLEIVSETQLDLAMLEDLGYTVDWTKLPRSPYVSEYPRPQNQTPRSLVGLWEFRKPSDLNRAGIGYPLLYRPASAGLVEVSATTVLHS